MLSKKKSTDETKKEFVQNLKISHKILTLTYFYTLSILCESFVLQLICNNELNLFLTMKHILC